MILDIIKMPDLLRLSAMNAFALGRRAKWKDYVGSAEKHKLFDYYIFKIE